MVIPLASLTTRQMPHRAEILRKQENRAHCGVARSLFGIAKLRLSRLALHPDSPCSHSSHDGQQTLCSFALSESMQHITRHRQHHKRDEKKYQAQFDQSRGI